MLLIMSVKFDKEGRYLSTYGPFWPSSRRGRSAQEVPLRLNHLYYEVVRATDTNAVLQYERWTEDEEDAVQEMLDRARVEFKMPVNDRTRFFKEKAAFGDFWKTESLVGSSWKDFVRLASSL